MSAAKRTVGCDRCADLVEPFPLKTRADFTNAVRVIRDNLEHGVIVEVHYSPPVVVQLRKSKFLELSLQGPWPDDHLQYHFACAACGQPYRLEVDTYHGGGRWEAVPRA